MISLVLLHAAHSGAQWPLEYTGEEHVLALKLCLFLKGDSKQSEGNLIVPLWVYRTLGVAMLKGTQSPLRSQGRPPLLARHRAMPSFSLQQGPPLSGPAS